MSFASSFSRPFGIAPRLSDELDSLIGSVRGTIAFRGRDAWQALVSGTSGQVLTTQGANADPLWADAATQDLTFAYQDIRSLALMVSELKGDRLNMVDGVAETFGDTSDVNLTLTTNYVFDAINRAIQPSRNQFTGGTAISGGDAGSGSLPANAFDGASTEWQSAQYSGSVSGTAYVGKDFGSGTTRDVRQVVLLQGALTGETISSVKVQYSDNLTTWTTAVTAALVNQTGSFNTIAVPSSGAHRAWRVLANSEPSSGWYWGVQELGFNAAPNTLTLVSNGFSSEVASPSKARVVAQVASGGDAFTPNTDLVAYASRNAGATYTAGTLAYVETLADGSAIYETGAFDISAQSAGSTMSYKFVTANQKFISLSGAILQWRP